MRRAGSHWTWRRCTPTRAAVVGIFGLAAAAAPGAATAYALAYIRKRGKLIVGVKSDQPPYGFLGSDGQIAGLEPDLARDVAAVLGVQLELVPVVSSNRMQFLDQGRIDLVIATMAATDERRDMEIGRAPCRERGCQYG